MHMAGEVFPRSGPKSRIGGAGIAVGDVLKQRQSGIRIRCAGNPSPALAVREHHRRE